ncbi:MAG: hypothetical protein WAK91_02980 [Candidatus Acidiferrales bacterium]|jgi:hypothetical protein
MPDFSPAQIAILSRLNSLDFVLVAFPMYANYVGVRRDDCAALLVPESGAGLQILGEPSWLINGNLSVKIADAGSHFYIWKKSRIEATADRLALVAKFASDLASALVSIP